MFQAEIRSLHPSASTKGIENAADMMADMKEEEYLSGLLEAGAATPPSPDGQEEIEVEAAEDLVKRISMVEAQLFDWCNSLEFSDEDRPVKLPEIKIPANLPVHAPHAYPCQATFRRLPSNPAVWPQAPVMMRPTPGSDTKIRGIRYTDSLEYQHFAGFCAGCILPVNTGKERPGKSRVVDFETPYFVGTLLVRIRDAKPSSNDEDYQNESYFDNKKRRFQVVVRGRFTESLPMGKCVTGQSFERPAGKLPGKLIVSAIIRFMSTLAPQLEATFGNQPRFLTPLVATAHTVQAKELRQSSASGDGDDRAVKYRWYPGATDVEEELEEPPLDSPTNVLLGVQGATSGGKSVDARRKARKKVFNAIAAKKGLDPAFDTNKEYTFEFYQHLLLLTDPEDFKIDFNYTTVGLSPTLDGQPIKILAARRDTDTAELIPLWSFDLWHRSLYPFAERALKGTEEKQ